MMTFRYYKVLDDGRTELFNVTTCEKCGQTVQDVNAVGGFTYDVPKYRELGIQEWTGPWPLDELGWCELLGSAVCSNCQVYDDEG